MCLEYCQYNQGKSPFLFYGINYLYSSFTTPHLEQRSTMESSPILKQLCRKSKGLSRFVPKGPPVGAEYKDPSEFILDCVLDPNLLPLIIKEGIHKITFERHINLVPI